jgi:two-component system chemotaxis response regulator CheB
MILEGQVLVAPGGHHTVVGPTGDRIVLTDDPPVHGVRPSADVLFSSMAKVYGERVIGIVLTGMGRDGTRGITEIKNNGGTVIVQDPNDAIISGMPQSAINTNMVDHIVPLQQIPDRLFEFIKALDK